MKHFFITPTYILNACECNWYQITTDDLDFNIAIFQQGQNNFFWLLKWTE